PSISRNVYDMAESEADSLADGRDGLGDAVQPVVLRRTAHYEQTPVADPIRERILALGVAQDEIPLRSERQGRDDRILTQLRFRVCVNSDRILAVPVPVKEQAVK